MPRATCPSCDAEWETTNLYAVCDDCGAPADVSASPPDYEDGYGVPVGLVGTPTESAFFEMYEDEFGDSDD